MELEELQSAWTQMSLQLEKQKKLTHQIIMEMTQQKYYRRFRKLFLYEGAGAVICLLAAAYLIWNISRLDTWYLLAFGGMALLFLTALPVWILYSLYRIQSIDLLQGLYRNTLLEFTRAKQRLLIAQRTAITLGFLFILIIFPLAGKLLNNEDFFKNNQYFWLWYVPLIGVFLFYFSRMAYRHYLRAIADAESLIRDLESE